MNAFDHKSIVATRTSALAKTQTNIACQWIARRCNNFTWDLLGLSTQGDTLINIPLKEIGGKGVFVKELQQALLNKNADLAVHSMKDMPIEQHSDLLIAGYCDTAGSPWDVLVSSYSKWEDLPLGSIIGTSSLRRAAQFLQLRPDCKVKPIRGNVITRLSRLEAGDFDALILAEAGITRLDLSQKYDAFTVEEMVPAFNQGILGIECRISDDYISKQLIGITCSSLYTRVQWEREISHMLDASCKSAIGVYAHIKSEKPLEVDLHIFTCTDWLNMRTRKGTFSSLKDAKKWVIDCFELEHRSWAICCLEFT